MYYSVVYYCHLYTCFEFSYGGFDTSMKNVPRSECSLNYFNIRPQIIVCSNEKFTPQNTMNILQNYKSCEIPFIDWTRREDV